MTKKLLFSFAITASVFSAQAQSIDNIKEQINDKKYAEARESITKYMAAKPDNAKKSEIWYLKGLAENLYSKEDASKSNCPNCKEDAFASFKKYQELDSKNIMMTIDNNVQLFDLYNGFFDQAGAAYGASDFKVAYEKFLSASAVQDYIKSKKFEYNGFSFGVVDTNLLNNIGICALQAKMYTEAMDTYEKLVDAKAATDEMRDNCVIAAANVYENGGQAKGTAFMEKCKNYFKENSSIIEKQLDMNVGLKPEEIIAKYDAALPTIAGKYNANFNYAAELYNYIFAGENKPKDAAKAEALTKLENQLQTVLRIKKTPEANLLMARFLYNKVYESQDVIKGLTGTDAKTTAQKNKLKEEQKAVINSCLEYAGQVESLTANNADAVENYNSAIEISEKMYRFLNNKAKTDEYIKKKK
jgi:hypothetical protein